MAQASFYLDEGLIDSLDEIAHERSAPGDTVSRSEVASEALREYIDRHRSESGHDGAGDSPDEAQATN